MATKSNTEAAQTLDEFEFWTGYYVAYAIVTDVDYQLEMAEAAYLLPSGKMVKEQRSWSSWQWSVDRLHTAELVRAS